MLKHTHIVISAQISESLTHEKDAVKWITALVKGQKMNLLAPPIAAYSNAKGNQGMTVCALITTSHVIAHFWDEP